MRVLHRWPGLVAAVLLIVISLSGAALSVFPAADSIGVLGVPREMTVAELASRVQGVHPSVSEISRSQDGAITARWSGSKAPLGVVIDPMSGKAVNAVAPSPVLTWLTELHRSLFLGNGGRLTMAAGAATMLLLTISGIFLVARRTGGVRRFFTPLKGTLASRIHVEFARIAVVGFALSSLSALWLTASTFGIVPQGSDVPPFPTHVSGKAGYPVAQSDVLKVTPVDRLRQLTFPQQGEAGDVYTLQTDAGTGYIDQGTGRLLAWKPLDVWGRAYQLVYMLHTGRGAPLLGLVLGLMALSIPALGVTGVVTWLRGRRARPRIRGNVAAGHAETVVLVGSEGGSTWGFAATLHAALAKAGDRVHVAPMSTFSPRRYGQARRIILLAATYGDGDAPAGAGNFIQRLAALDAAPRARLAVLGFGDRSFPHFCAYAERVAALAAEKDWPRFLPMETVDRQSPQDFTRWGRALGASLGIDLELNHQPVTPRTATLVLADRREYGADVQAPSAILRFALPRTSVWQRLTGRGFGGFAAGDLVGIVPESSAVARFYSLASSRRDGFVEICVSRHPNGLCSGQLLALAPGDTVEAFVRHNPGFRPQRGKAPVILVGAGTGIGPLAGFIRANREHRPMHLYFGTRHPDSDLLYGEEMPGWHRQGRLSSVATAYSRTADRAYVQDVLREDTSLITQDFAEGGQILVCGGREMARAVAEVIAEIVAPMGLTPALLKAEGRYAEDIY